jgi:multiple sugar transport system substrate-binding protein
MVRQDGRIYALVHDTGVQNLFYRKDLLTQLGVDTKQPATWDDLIARLVDLKGKTGDTPIVIPAGTAWGGSTWTEGFQPILGGTDKNYYSLKTGKWDLKSTGFPAVFDLYSKLYSKGLLPVQDLENPNPWEPTKYVKFPAGKIQVAAQGTNGWKFDWGPDGAAPIPGLTTKVDTWQYPALRSGDKPFGWSGLGAGFAIPEKSKHKDEAMLLAEYLSSGKPLAEQLVTSGAAAPRDDLADVKPYADEPKLLQAGRDLKTSVYVPTGDGSQQVAQAVASATELIITGKADGAQAYAAFVKDATDLLGPSLVK